MAKAASKMPLATKEAIVELAIEALTRNGFNGVSFLSIGKQLGIGHSNIHYYFRTKDDLVEYVLRLYTDEALEFFAALWRDPDVDFRTKMYRTRDWLHANFVKFSANGGSGRIGLLGSMAADVEHLSPGAKKILRDINVGLDDHIRTGIDIAVERGDLIKEAPRSDIALQILWLLYSSRIIVKQGNRFENLDNLFRWTTEVIEQAYRNPSASRWMPASKEKKAPSKKKDNGPAPSRPKRKSPRSAEA